MVIFFKSLSVCIYVCVKWEEYDSVHKIICADVLQQLLESKDRVHSRRAERRLLASGQDESLLFITWSFRSSAFHSEKATFFTPKQEASFICWVKLWESYPQ